jgi:hypothetical protein
MCGVAIDNLISVRIDERNALAQRLSFRVLGNDGFDPPRDFADRHHDTSRRSAEPASSP